MFWRITNYRKLGFSIVGGVIRSRANSGLYHSEREGSPKGRVYTYRRDFPGGSVQKNVPAMQGT